MTDRVQLIGAEDVRSAGNAMRAAAEDMKQAAMNLDGSLERQQRFMDDWLARFEAMLTNAMGANAMGDIE